MKPLHTAAELLAVVSAASPPGPCKCALGPCEGWESLAEYRWEPRQMVRVATLREPDVDEPTLDEKHPAGTRYDSPDAPIAPAFFPYNRCDVWHCTRCDRHLMRYTEFGGYNVDPRVRVLDPRLLID